MKAQFVEFDSSLYEDALRVRVEAFFEGMPNALELIQDKFENTNSYFLVIVNNNKVVATGRLHLSEFVGVVSQMAISKNYQKQGYGSAVLKELIVKAKSLNCASVNLSARETAVLFYKKHGFVTVGKKYPSLKTGIRHIEMSRDLVWISFYVCCVYFLSIEL